MASTTLYRKWRSNTFADVIGQRHVTRTLLNALESQRLSHAYLFSGPRGVGKTSVARVLAKAVNCLHNDNGRGEPCNECSMCQAIAQGRCLDVLEIDAASNRGIDEIRDLRDKVNFAPNEARSKFYILDEAHMLTNEASNALLKTLEEPPSHVVFVLVTTEPHRLPATILSRCQRFDFRRIHLRDIQERLAFISREENIDIDGHALELVARLATGSMRDAVSLLDQLVAYCGSHIEADDARTVLGIASSTRARDLVHMILHKQTRSALELVNEVVAEGADLRQLNREIIEHLRGVLLIGVSPESSSMVEATADVLDRMREDASLATTDQLVDVVKVFAQADVNLRVPVPFQLPLELACVEAVGKLEPRPGGLTVEVPLARHAEAPPLRPVAREIAVPARRPVPSEVPPSPKPAPTSVEPQILARGEPVEGPAVVTVETASVVRNADVPPRDAASADIDEIVGAWPQVIAHVGRSDMKAQALLRDAEPQSLEGDCVVLNFAHAFHRDKMDTPANLVLAEKAFNAVLGGAWRVKCLLGGPSRPVERRKGPADDPLVREAVKRGARVVGVRKTDADLPDLF